MRKFCSARQECASLVVYTSSLNAAFAVVASLRSGGELIGVVSPAAVTGRAGSMWPGCMSPVFKVWTSAPSKQEGCFRHGWKH